MIVAGGAITPSRAWTAVDWHVIGFLFGVFLLGQALVASGWLYQMSARLLGPVARADALILAVIFGAGLASAFLMNDTLALVGTPLVLRLAAARGLPPVLLLLALAFAVTLGSAMSPIGNPQNLIIAVQSGMQGPFVEFLLGLGVPTLIILPTGYGARCPLQVRRTPMAARLGPRPDSCPLWRESGNPIRTAGVEGVWFPRRGRPRSLPNL